MGLAGVAGILLSLSCLALAPAAAPPTGALELAVVYPPWWSSARSAAAAGRQALILRPGAAPFILVVRDQAPGLQARLRSSGAIFFLNAMLAGCGEPRTS